MNFDVVVAADLDWGIGKGNALPWPKLRADFAHFKTLTMAASEGRRNAIVMGRKTWDSLGRPLPGRRSVVVSRAALTLPEGVIAANSLDGSLDDALDCPDVENVFVIGGGEIYRLALDHFALRHVYLTRVDGRFDCDVRIPDLDARFVEDPAWPSATHEENGVRFWIERLVRR